jgi:gliding motility-associated-like protein
MGFEVSLAAGGGYGSILTLPQTGGTVSNTSLYVRSSASASTGNISGNVVLTSIGAISQNVAVTGTVNAMISPSINIAASANNICAGTTVTFTATPVNGGSAPVYQWQLNGNNAGANSPTFSNNTFANGDIISCQLTSNAACAALLNATSNSITMIVNPLVAPSIVIAASVNNICAGTPATFTATPTGGGSTPAYQWQVNGNNTGTNSATFSSSTLANGDVVSCVMTSNAVCAAPANATSNSITMIVNPLVAPSIVIAASVNNICAGTPVTFTATPTGGGSTPVYRWLVNGSNTGTNSTTFSSGTFANGDVVSCVMTSNAVCAAPANATSNSITMIVNPLVAPSIVIAASVNNICAGTPVTFTATPTGGGSTPVYQWMVNSNNTGTNSPTFSSSTLANGDVVSCATTSNAVCATPANATSNSIIMNVTSPVTPSVSIAASANNICSGTPVTFTATPINGGSTPAYQWQVNGNNTGTNTAIFTTGILTNGDAVSCIMTSSTACAAPANATSNSITMNVYPLPIVNAGVNKTIKEGGSVVLSATATGNLADITWSPSTGLSNNKILNPIASPVSTTMYTLMIQTTDGCIGVDSVTIKVSIDIVIPNAFTPNGDGINDTWDIKYIDTYPGCTIQIYNRYGQNVYSSIGYGIPWNGTYRGANLPTGTYYYIINLQNSSKLLSGYVAIIR